MTKDARSEVQEARKEDSNRFMPPRRQVVGGSASVTSAFLLFNL